jgi:hypothetical protein
MAIHTLIALARRCLGLEEALQSQTVHQPDVVMEPIASAGIGEALAHIMEE